MRTSSLLDLPSRSPLRPLLFATLLAGSACALVLDLPDPKLDETVGSDSGFDATDPDGATLGDGGGGDGASDDGGGSNEGGDGPGVDAATCDLTLAQNCGACGVDCSNGSCSQGICTLADKVIGRLDIEGPLSIVLYQNDAYVTAGGVPSIIRCATNGCLASGATTISQSLDFGSTPYEIIVDSTGTLFWTSYSSGRASDGIYRHPTNGQQVHLNPGAQATYTTDLALSANGADVYWTVYGDEGAGGWICPRTGCPDGGPLPVTGVIDEAKSVVTTPKGVVWAFGDRVRLCAAADCSTTVTTLATAQGVELGALTAYKDSHVYWVASYPNALIARAPLEQTGGVFELVYPTGAAPALPEVPEALLIVGDTLYWTLDGTVLADGGNTTDGKVQKCSLPACATAIDVAVNQAGPHGLASDGTAIYWINSGVADDTVGTGTIMKAPL